MDQKYHCPCCGYLTLEEPVRHFDICDVCSWEDDNIQYDSPDYRGGANKVSLNEARRNFLEFGASDKNFLPNVRAPTDEEISSRRRPYISRNKFQGQEIALGTSSAAVTGTAI
ncbi:MAG: hypothetical protein EOP04_01435 [Proteobacteria bacterium]|nr:MAG: hypothetical protein EOP04_01435 [Pseudomonadota bacterium]